MPSTLIRYTLDPTGINSDNLVVGEVHTLTTLQFRAIAPSYGAFFAESLLLRDHVTNQILVKGVDYKVSELLQEATLKFGKEINLLIIITNPNISNKVRLNYQVLGGLYQLDAANLKNIYETSLKNDNPVDWINVLNKPLQYPPSFHNHLLTDVYGFEALVVSLERIKNAIVLSNVPAFEALITWIQTELNKIKNNFQIVTPSEISSGHGNTKLVTFDRLLQAAEELNFNSIVFFPNSNTYDNGQTINVGINTSRSLDNSTLFWNIEHLTTSDVNFNTLSGVIPMYGNRGSFNVSIAKNVSKTLDGFRINIRSGSPTGAVMARSGVFNIIGDDEYKLINSITSCCLYNPKIKINAASYFVIGTKKGH